MSSDLVIVVALAATGALTSIIGGLLAIFRRPTSLFLSVALGFASGVLIATIALEILPEALHLGSVGVVVAGFVVGTAVIYAFDLFMNRGWTAGERAEQRDQVDRFHHRQPVRANEGTILAIGTAGEEVIEGLAIGAGAAVQPGLAAVIAASIAVDNVSEGLSIGQLVRSENPDNGRRTNTIKILARTGLVGGALLLAAVIGLWAFRDLPDSLLSFALAAGGAGMLYLTITDLLPVAEEHHYEHSSALAAATGFVVILAITNVQWT